MADRDLILEAKNALEASAQGWRDAREHALLCHKMHAGEEHWPAEIVAERRGQGRPTLTVNKLGQFVSQVTGRYRLANMAIRVQPVDDRADIERAKLYEGMLRAIQYESTAQVAYLRALTSAAVGGFGWLRVAREYESQDSWDQVLRVVPIPNPFSVYVDPQSLAFDLSDAAYLLVTDEWTEEAFEAKWPGASFSDVEVGIGDRTNVWHNKAEKTVKVAEYWRKVPVKRRLLLVGTPEDPTQWETVEWPKGEAAQQDLIARLDAFGATVLKDREAEGWKIMMSLVSAGEVLEKDREWLGTSFPVVPVFGEETYFDGKRRFFGVISHALDPQRIYDYQWSAAVEMIALQPKAPFLLTPHQMNNGTHDLSAYWNNANKTLPYLLFNPDQNAPVPQRQPSPSIPTGMLELCDRSTQDLRETTGIYQAALGGEGNETSGVAIRSRQTQSDVATAAWPDNLRLAMQALGQKIVELIPKVYDRDRIVRVLGEDLRTTDLVNLTWGDGGDRGKYDVVVSVGQSWATRREENQQAVLELVRVLPPEVVAAAAPIILKYTDSPVAQELADRLEAMAQGMMQPAGGGPMPGPEEVQDVSPMAPQLPGAMVPGGVLQGVE